MFSNKNIQQNQNNINNNIFQQNFNMNINNNKNKIKIIYNIFKGNLYNNPNFLK